MRLLFSVYITFVEDHKMLFALPFVATLLCFTPLFAIIIAANTAPKTQ